MGSELKEKVGAAIAERVVDGDLLGIGTGSTVTCAIEKIGTRVKSENLSISAVPTSLQTSWLCQKVGITVLDCNSVSKLSWAFDGADEVDQRYRLIKGGGGALLLEKIVASLTDNFIVIVDEAKVVAKLGEAFAIPVELVPEARSVVEQQLAELGAKELKLRQAVSKAGPVVTEKGNLLIDASFDGIADDLEQRINGIVGVVENGLFINYASEVLVGRSSGVELLARS